jgi:predicted ATPase
VIEVVGARTQRLSADARTAAEVIAVAANRVQLTVLGDAAGLDGGDLAAAITELVDSGLVDEVTGPAPEYQYAHALLRDAVVASLSGQRRMQLHLSLARAIERVHEADRRSVLPELARHYAASAVVGGRDKAVYYGARAAAQARQTAAYDEGVSVLRTVLDAVPGSGPDQVDLAIDLIDLLQRSGHHLESLAVGRRSFGDARGIGDVATSPAAVVPRSPRCSSSSLRRWATGTNAPASGFAAHSGARGRWPGTKAPMP